MTVDDNHLITKGILINLIKLGSIRDRMCATAKIALNPVIIAFQ